MYGVSTVEITNHAIVKWKKYREKVGIPAIIVELSLKLSLKAIRDIVIIEEDPIEQTVDSESGLTPEVIDALKTNRLVIPDKYEAFASKFPCTGKVISTGEKCYHVEEGDKVIFARMGGQRTKLDGVTYVTIREKDVHAVIS